MTWIPQPEIVGWRVWCALHPDKLMSPFLLQPWPTNAPMKAVCERTVPYSLRHEPPGQYCMCGIWATRRQPTVFGNVLGLVRLWGTVAIHGDEGWRGQYARPVAIFWGPLSRITGQGGVSREMTHRIADTYGVPCIDLRMPLWPAAAKELGAPTTDWLEHKLKKYREYLDRRRRNGRPQRDGGPRDFRT